MRIMTRNALQPTVAARETAAVQHLLRVRYGRRGASVFVVLGMQEGDPDVRQIVAGAEIELRAPVPQDALDAQQVALIADLIPLAGRQRRQI
jgi:hypothetical protein